MKRTINSILTFIVMSGAFFGLNRYIQPQDMAYAYYAGFEETVNEYLENAPNFRYMNFNFHYTNDYKCFLTYDEEREVLELMESWCEKRDIIFFYDYSESQLIESMDKPGSNIVVSMTPMKETTTDFYCKILIYDISPDYIFWRTAFHTSYEYSRWKMVESESEYFNGPWLI